jgi:T5SS/PEP-CTERM-associated repeat protein
MKQNTLMTSAVLPTKLTSKLALMLLALPVCGAFAAAPDYSSTLSDATTLGTNAVTDSTLAASVVGKAGTSSDLNTNYIGWSVTPTQAVNLYWTGTALTTTSGSTGQMSIGGAVASSATASSSYNQLTVDSYVNISAGSLHVGYGSIGAESDAKLVDPAKLANNNSLNVSGAAYSAVDGHIVATSLNHSGPIMLGYFGNGNAINISAGAQVASASTLSIGTSDQNNSTSGCNNSITISGKTTVSVIGYTGSSASTLAAVGAEIGLYGSGNTITVSDNAVLDLKTGSLTLGNSGDANKITATNASVKLDGISYLGLMPASTGNEVSLTNSAITGSSGSSSGDFNVGYFGSSNKLALSNSSISVNSLCVGLGDGVTADTDAHAADGTKGLEVSEGSNNTLTSTGSTLQLNSNGGLIVGDFGSGNTVTLNSTNLYKTWDDAIQSGASAKDNIVQLNEITGINVISVGYGYVTTSSIDGSALGCNNSLTIGNASVFATSNSLFSGFLGSGNSVTISGGSAGYVDGIIYVGGGNPEDVRQGSSNTLTITDKGTSLASGSDLVVGFFGSGDKLTVSGGASLSFVGKLWGFGEGSSSTSTVNNSAFGSENVITVTGADSTLSFADTEACYIGHYGSNNLLAVSDGAKVTFAAQTITLGSYGEEFGTVLSPNNVFSQGNKIVVSGGSEFVTAGGVVVGASGIKNSFEVTGANTFADIFDGTLVVGRGNSSGTLFGSGNSVTVSDSAVLLVDDLYVGSDLDYFASNNNVTVSSGAIVVVGEIFVINNVNGDHNVLRLNNGMVAMPGKFFGNEITWEQYIFTGVPNITKKIGNLTTGLVDQGAIQIWDAKTSSYVTAKKSDLSLKYYSSEAEAKAGTGYAGLAGYTVLTTAKTNSWAGTLYDAGDNVYCSSWYGWFYNEAAYGDYIMSYNDYAWQYVSPDSTPDNAYFYDYSLGAWLYTNQTYFQNKWVYNYGTKAWQKLEK